jgi:alpha-glucosidase
VLLLGLRGTPFLYAGEELGLEDAEVPKQRVVDPGGRDGCRAPIPWQPGSGHGWGTGDPWLPWPSDAASRNVESLREDPGSILHLYRRLLAARRRSPALRRGGFELLDASGDVLAFRRSLPREGDDARLVVVNFGDAPAAFAPPGRHRVEIASDGRGEGGEYPGRLGADQALVLVPLP